MFLKNIRRCFILIIVAISVFMSMSDGLAASFAVKVNNSSAKVYKKASYSSDNASVSYGTSLTAKSFSNGWVRVTKGRYTGYMRSDDLDLRNRITAYIKDSTNLYPHASSSYSPKAYLQAGTKVYVISIDTNYCKVQNSSGSKTGYVRTSMLSKNRNSGNSTKVGAVIRTAESLLGTSYDKMDCSYFVGYCYLKHGYKLKRNSASQADDNRFTKITNLSNLKRGDLVYFDCNQDKKVDHVVLYLGNGTFIESSKSYGGVRKQSFSSYYRSRFVCARRIC